MKLSSLVWSMFGVIALSACSENEMPEVKNPVTKDGGRFLAVEISNPAVTKALERNVVTKALKRNYEDGAAAENQINSLRFYFFDNNGNAAAVNASQVNYVDCTEEDIKSEIPEEGNKPNQNPNVEKRLQAVVVINTKNGDYANVNTLLAVANHETANLGTGTLSLDELRSKICENREYEAVIKDGKAHFLMTSSSYANADGQVNLATIKPENLCKTPEAAKGTPVDIYIERVVAKTRLKTAWEGMTTKEVTYDGKTYTAVALKETPEKKGEAGADIKFNGEQVYAIFKNWNITGTINKSYLLKKVNKLGSWNLGWAWNNSDFFRSFWAMNPDNATLEYISYNNINLEIGNGFAYCLENAADNFENGTKTVYNPTEKTSNRTQAIIAAVLVTVNMNNEATPISMAKWAGRDFTANDVKTEMLKSVKEQIWVKESTLEGEDAKFVTIEPKHVKLATATDAENANGNSEDSPRYLTFLQLDDEGVAKDVQFYSSASDDATINHKKVNEILASVPGAKVWMNGQTYYYTDLKHLGADAAKGLYGVVRNHIYDVNLNTVTGLGTPIFDPNEVIIPQKPGEDETYIAAKINILSWRVVNNDTDLEW